MIGYNSKADVYSLGIATCEMANGIIPYSDMEPLLMLTEKIGGRCPTLLDKYAVPYLTDGKGAHYLLTYLASKTSIFINRFL